MNRFKPKSIMITVSFLMTFGLMNLLSCQNNAGNQKDPEITDQYPKIDSLFQQLVKHGKAHGAIAVAEKGDLKHNKAYGYARMGPDDTVKANLATRYQIGSITKTFTATAIMQLVEAGKLSLDTKLGEFYPGMPNADSITIELMLRHQSGLHNYTDSSWVEWRDEDRSKQAMLDTFKEYETEFQPGEQFAYSNTNYVLLGYILEELTGKSYQQVIKERISEPLGLNQTYYPKDQLQEGEARSYVWEEGEWDTMKRSNHQLNQGAGALISTPADLITFYRGLFQGRLVDSQSLAQMTTMTEGLTQANPYGLGLLKFPFGDKRAYGHTGGIDGYQAMAAYFPRDSVAVAFTGNAMNYSRKNITVGVLSIVFDRDYEIPAFDQEAVDLKPERLKRFSGLYKNENHPLNITLRVKDSTLMGQATNQPEFPLTPTSDTSFKYDRAGLEIRFQQPKQDTFQNFYLIQNGKFLFERQ